MKQDEALNALFTLRKIKTNGKELSLCYNFKFSNPYIYGT